MDLQFSCKKELLAQCPNCRTEPVVLLMTKMEASKDLLVCNNCKLAIFVKDMKRELFTT